jgi:hypothetical protein
VAAGYGARTGELSGVAETVLGHADPIGELADRAANAEIREGDLGAAFSGVASAYHAAVRRGVADVLRRHSAATATFGGKLADAGGRYVADDESGVRTIGEVDL